MRVHGIGLLGPMGRGVDNLSQALLEGRKPPLEIDAVGQSAPAIPACRVSQEAMKDSSLGPARRRADRFSLMALMAAADAVKDARIPVEDRGRMGCILGTGLGPHVTTFRFLEEILAYGDGGVSPTLFSHSVHNAAVSYITSMLGVRGPATTMTNFHFSFHQTLWLAECWLREKRCDYVLAGACEELGSVMEYVCSRKLLLAQDGILHPLSGEKNPPALPSEGAVFLLLSRRQDLPAYAGLQAVSRHQVKQLGRPDLHLLEADGMSGDESGYVNAAKEIDAPVAACAPAFGSLVCASAFHCAAAALIIKQGKAFPSPSVPNPRQLPQADMIESPIQSILSTRLDCSGNRAHLRLTPC